MQSPIVRKMLVIFVLLLGAIYFWWSRDSDASPGMVLIDPAEILEPREDEELAPTEGDVPIDVERASTVAQETTRRAPVVVRGRVVDSEGVALRDVTIVQQHPILSAGPVRSQTDGTFEIEVRELAGELVPDGAGWILLGGSRHLAEGQLEGYDLVVARATTVRGVVVDRHGAPVVDAAVRALAPGNTLLRFGTAATPVEHESQHAWTDARGHFLVGPLPDLPGTRITVTSETFSAATVPLPAERGELLRIVLEPREPR
jgi:hypothetical protein